MCLLPDWISCIWPGSLNYIL